MDVIEAITPGHGALPNRPKRGGCDVELGEGAIASKVPIERDDAVQFEGRIDGPLSRPRTGRYGSKEELKRMLESMEHRSLRQLGTPVPAIRSQSIE